jgi:hypothetical protein
MDWQNEIFQKYPKLFVQKDLPATKTCMCWSITCGEGWKHIIDKACQKIQEIADLYGADIQFSQVKEKFGGLRMYFDINWSVPEIDVAPREVETNPKNREIWDLVYKVTCDAEEESLKTCDVCGKPGTSRFGGWIVTRCDEHANKKGWE